jgi:hypothetical protein
VRGLSPRKQNLIANGPIAKIRPRGEQASVPPSASSGAWSPSKSRREFNDLFHNPGAQ